MSLRFLGFVCLTLCGSVGCYPDDSQENEDEQEESEEIIDETVSQPPPPAKKENPSSSDEGFDPCPSDTYVLWSADGTEYTIEIEVFCEPKKIFNTGCPEPSY